jgi:hypothetical protein
MSLGKVKNVSYSRPALRSTQPPIQWVPETPSPGVKWQGAETNDSLPTSA